MPERAERLMGVGYDKEAYDKEAYDKEAYDPRSFPTFPIGKLDLNSYRLARKSYSYRLARKPVTIIVIFRPISKP